MKYNKLYENWRRFTEDDSTGNTEMIENESIDEMIERIINETESRLLSEGRLDEGLMQSVFKFGKKIGIDKLALIAIMTYGANSPMAKNFVEDLEAQLGDKVADVHQAASEMASSLKSKGIELTKSPEGDPVFDYGETTQAEDSDAMVDRLEKDGFDTGIKRLGHNVYRGDSKGFIFVADMDNSSYPEVMNAKKSLQARAAAEGGKLTAKTTITSVGNDFYLVKSTK